MLQTPSFTYLAPEFGIGHSQVGCALCHTSLQFRPRLEKLLIARAQLLLGLLQIINGFLKLNGVVFQLLLSGFALRDVVGNARKSVRFAPLIAHGKDSIMNPALLPIGPHNSKLFVELPVRDLGQGSGHLLAILWSDGLKPCGRVLA
jgi:hypothetical protein